MRRLSFLALALFVALIHPALTDNSAQPLPFAQDWVNTSLITTNDDWSGVPGVVGHLGDYTTATPVGIDPQTLLDDFTTTTAVDVLANQTNPNTAAAGGVAEFHLPNPTVALQGGGLLADADAPFLLMTINTVGMPAVEVSYNVRDLDGSADNAVQQVALHYRIGTAGPFTNLALGYVADATTGPNLATLVTPVSVLLPQDTLHQPIVQLRVMTTNAGNEMGANVNDEWIGIDDIRIGVPGLSAPPTGSGLANPAIVQPGVETTLTVAVTPGWNPPSTGLTVTADLTAIGGAAAQPFVENGTTNVFTHRATIAAGTPPGRISLPVTIQDAQQRIGTTTITVGVLFDLSISEIQGTGSRSPFEGQAVTTRGIVIGRSTTRFFIQAEAPAPGVSGLYLGDGDPATSDGIAVTLTSGMIPALNALVSVTGMVNEVAPDPGGASVTELRGTSVTVASGVTPPPAVTLTPADTNPRGPLDQLERFECMRVRIASLTVVGPTQGTVPNPSAENAGTVQTNGVFYAVITGVARPFREAGVPISETLPPDAPANVPRFDENPERIRVDSDFFLGATRMDLATGDRVTCTNDFTACVNGANGSGVLGVLDYAGRAYTLLPEPLPPPLRMFFTITPAVEVPAAGPDQLAVASFNLQRFFDDRNDPGNPVVMTVQGFGNRLTKLSRTVTDFMLSPDIIGVQEVEAFALQELARVTGYTSHLIEGNDPTRLNVGFLVKNSSRVQVVGEVEQAGKDAQYVNPRTGNLETLFDRPPLILRAAVEGLAGAPLPVTVIVNSLQSMAGANDPVDGARVRAKRAAQAEFLAGLIQARQTADPQEHILSLGDYRAFEFNDGLVDVMGTIRGVPAPPDEVVVASSDLVQPDLINLIKPDRATDPELVPPHQRYSFVSEAATPSNPESTLDGNARAIDHALVTRNLFSRVEAVQYARVNADFPEFARGVVSCTLSPTNQQAHLCGKRSSSHDPLVVYLDLKVPVSIGDASVSEGNQGRTTLTFDVTLGSPVREPVTVEFATKELTADLVGKDRAVAGEDYESASGRVVFEPGVTSQPVTVEVVGDFRFERDEAFLVKLKNLQGTGVEIGDGTGEGTIRNDDTEPSLTIGDVTVDEGNDGTSVAKFTVSLEGLTGLTTTVNFATADVTAQQGSDYFAESGTLTFEPGDTARTVHVTISGDRLNEPDETFAVDLTGAVNASISDAQGIGTIANDDDLPKLSVDDVTVVEGDAAGAVIAARLSAPSGRTVVVNFATADGTATDGNGEPRADYVANAGTLVFAPGDVEKTITVRIENDTLSEGTEHFFVDLADATNAAISDARAVVTIQDDDPLPTASIEDVTVAEGNAGPTPAMLVVTLDRPSGQEVIVEFETKDGTAKAGLDYIESSGHLVFREGETRATVIVPVLGDTFFEPDETVEVRLDDLTNAAPGRTRAVLTISNDDLRPAFRIGDASVVEGNDGAAHARFTVMLSAASFLESSVSFQTDDLVASAGSDYTAAAGTLVFEPGQTSRTLTVAVSGDRLNEANETFVVTLSDPVNAALADATGTGTILNDDPPPAIRIRNAAGDEPVSGVATMRFKVELSAPSGRPASVSFRTLNLTAVAGRDYEGQSGTISFGPGEVEAFIEIAILADDRMEPAQFFLVQLREPVNAKIADAFATGRIDDASQPRIEAVSPGSGKTGDKVTITGANFRDVRDVRFGGKPAHSVRVVSSREIRVVVPPDARTGPVSVKTPRGTGSSAEPFVVVRKP